MVTEIYKLWDDLRVSSLVSFPIFIKLYFCFWKMTNINHDFLTEDKRLKKVSSNLFEDQIILFLH